MNRVYSRADVLQKDIKFLERLLSLSDRVLLLEEVLEDLALADILSPYHPINTGAFKEEFHSVFRSVRYLFKTIVQVLVCSPTS